MPGFILVVRWFPSCCIPPLQGGHTEFYTGNGSGTTLFAVDEQNPITQRISTIFFQFESCCATLSIHSSSSSSFLRPFKLRGREGGLHKNRGAERSAAVIIRGMTTTTMASIHRRTHCAVFPLPDLHRINFILQSADPYEICPLEMRDWALDGAMLRTK